jgi:heat-inducible transcriptional repressor
VRVVIGREHAAPSMQDCALITAPYWMGGEVTGTLGVVGPMRIEYARMMAVVNYMARHIEQLMREEISAA